jgi:hypothetical protein
MRVANLEQYDNVQVRKGGIIFHGPGLMIFCVLARDMIQMILFISGFTTAK